jgi:MSHA biogenesis protein MshP
VSCITRPTHHRQRGFSLVASIFILVVLGLLGAAMVTINSVQHTTVAQALQAAHAYEAARAGVEWATHRVVNDGACVANGNIALTDPVLAGFQVTMNCASTSHQETNRCFNVYHLRASAQRSVLGNIDFVSRQIEAKVTDAPGTPAPPGGCP